MNPPRTILAPKAHWCRASRAGERTTASQWADVTSSPLFAEAMQTAWAEYAARVAARPASLAEAASNTLRLEGAYAFWHVLANLGDPDVLQARGRAADALEPT